MSNIYCRFCETPPPENPSYLRKVYNCKNCKNKTSFQPEFCQKTREIEDKIIICGCKEFEILEMYSLDLAISYNPKYIFIIGERQIGKTYAVAEYVIHIWQEHGFKFVFMRRFKTEGENALKNFLKLGYLIDKKGVYYEKETIIFDKKGKEKEIKDKKYIGYFITMSTASRLRGGVYDDVKTLVWDEIADEDGSTWRKETRLFYSIITTLFTGAYNTQVIGLSNNVDPTLPIWKEFQPRWNQEIFYNAKRKAFIHIVSESKNSMGDVDIYLKGSEYYDYAKKNKALESDDLIIGDWELEYIEPIYQFRLLNNARKVGVFPLEDKFVLNFLNEDYEMPIKYLDSWSALINSEIVDLDLGAEIISYWHNKKLLFTDKKLKSDIMKWLKTQVELID